MDARVVSGSTSWEDIRDAIDFTSSDEHFWLNERDLAHCVEIKFGSKMGEGFDFFDVKVGAKIVAKGVCETNDVGEGKLFFEDFFLDANEDFLLGGATREITASSPMSGAGESNCFDATNSIRLTGFKDNAGIIVVFDIFVEGYGDTT